MRLTRTRSFLLAVSMTLSACSLLTGTREDLIVYAPVRAHSEREVPASHAARPWQLIVAEPQAISPLNGTRIVVMPQPGAIQFYKGARWRDNAPVMLQDLLIQAFQDSANLAGIGTASSNIRADFILQSNLEEFQAEYRGDRTPVVTIRLAMQLIDNASGRVIANRRFAVEQRCASPQLANVFSTFELALNRLVADVVTWTVESGDTEGSAARGLH